MRHGLRPIAMAFGTLAVAALALPGTAHAASAPTVAAMGPVGTGPQVERALFLGPGEGYTNGNGMIESVHYRRYHRRHYRRLPWWAYRYWRPRHHRYYKKRYWGYGY